MKSKEDYVDLIKAIKELGEWWDCLDSTWLVVSGHSAGQICDMLKRHLDRSDRILVFPVGKKWASDGFRKPCLEWLQKNWEPG